MDLYESRWVVLGSFGIALVIVIIYIWLMDKCAFWLAWISVALIQASLVLMGFGAWQTRTSVMTDNDDSNDDYGTYLWWAAILSWVFAGIWYIFMACNFQSLRVSIAIIETAADWFADTKRIMFVPFMYFIFGVLLVAGWVGC